MELSREIEYLDLHVAGEPLRVATKIFEDIPGKTMMEKREYAMRELDGLRRLLLLEPRGHADMYGALLTPPVEAGSDFGVLFMHGGGMSTMCGHGTIALARAAEHLGLVKCREGKNTVTIDAPSATVRATVHVRDGKAEDISFRNAPSFAYALDAPVRTKRFGTVHMDIGYGAAFMVFVRGEELGMDINTAAVPEMISAGMVLTEAVISQVDMTHPLDERLNARDNGICLMISQPPEVRGKEVLHKNFTVYGEGQFDRSPTGTGSSALAAILRAKGILEPDMRLINRGITDIPFIVGIEDAQPVGGHAAVQPTVSAMAYISGRGAVVLEPDDPLKDGFAF
ncbi:MAG: proline racemase family protein [Clostridia bacterium]|nr:proline racemase family protein [Clostridia bacterium]